MTTTSSWATVSRGLIQSEVRGWIQANWNTEVSLLDWRGKLAAEGWAVPSWPERWHGRGLPEWSDEIVAAELSDAGAPGLPVGGGVLMAGPTILAHGPDTLRKRFLLPILTGEERWCALFSEPGAGSDLAGLTTRAVRDGDEWVVTGQKVWNSHAHDADLAMLLARTDSEVPKHDGLTYFVLPMHQPGVEVRPLRQMNNHSSFNEVFLTEARIPLGHVVGTVGGGWRVAQTSLAVERQGYVGWIDLRDYPASGGRALKEARRETEEYLETFRWYPQRAGRVDLVLERARSVGCASDPLVRQEIARVVSMQRANLWTLERARAERGLGRAPGPGGSIGKLTGALIARQAAKTHSMISGAEAMLSGSDGPLDGVIAEILLSVPAQSIAGGTDEVQRNILGEKVLGLPREPSPDRGRAFSSLPRNG